MKIPAKIKAGALTYDVSFIEDVIAGPTGPAVGETNHSLSTIRLAKTPCRQRVELTFLHELCHIVFEKQGLQSRYSHEAEEEIVDNMSNGLYDILTENGLLK